MEQEQLKQLLTSLSIEEKIGQLIQLNGQFLNEQEGVITGPAAKLGIDKELLSKTGSILNAAGSHVTIAMQKQYLAKSDKKIPLLFMADIINGCRTIFPISLGLGATFDFEVVKRTAAIAAQEASAAGIHVTFSPMVDVVRDARWGRVMESYGEDTFLNCLFAKAMVEGYQGDMNPNANIASCVKHFAGYGAPNAGRDYNSVELSERMLREAYLPSYKAAIDAGCHLVMTSFNTINGIPATGNDYLLRDILRKEMNFDGVVISDFASVHELIVHGVASDKKEAALLAMSAGCEIDMMSSVYASQIKALVEEQQLDVSILDEAVMHVLELKNKLGLFENPYRGANHENEKKYHLCKEFRDFAKNVVTKACVLLKNEKQLLPLKKDTKVALIGPYANNPNLHGAWSFGVDPASVSTIKMGFEAIGNTACVQVAQGSTLLDSLEQLHRIDPSLSDYEQGDNAILLAEAITVAKRADVLVLALGEHPKHSGEGGSRTDLSIPNIQMKLLQEMKKLGKPIVTLLFSGRPLVINEIEDASDALLQCWFPGIEGGNGISALVYGDVNPSAKLPMSFPYTVGQCPIHYNECNTGRPTSLSGHSERFTSRYIDAPNEPRHVFGYGLSYSSFQYAPIELDQTTLNQKTSIQARVSIHNASTISGIETVQLYIQDMVGSVARPKKELKGIQKIELQPYETKKVSFIIHEDMLRFIRKDNAFASEPGTFKLYIGTSSTDTVEADFTLLA